MPTWVCFVCLDFFPPSFQHKNCTVLALFSHSAISPPPRHTKHTHMAFPPAPSSLRTHKHAENSMFFHIRSLLLHQTPKTCRIWCVFCVWCLSLVSGHHHHHSTHPPTGETFFLVHISILGNFLI